MWKGLLIGGLVGYVVAQVGRRVMADIFMKLYCAHCAVEFQWLDGGSITFNIPVAGWQTLRVCKSCLEVAQKNGTDKGDESVRATQAEKDDKLAKLWGLDE